MTREVLREVVLAAGKGEYVPVIGRSGNGRAESAAGPVRAGVFRSHLLPPDVVGSRRYRDLIRSGGEVGAFRDDPMSVESRLAPAAEPHRTAA